jgi:hypothetical protein
MSAVIHSRNRQIRSHRRLRVASERRGKKGEDSDIQKLVSSMVHLGTKADAIGSSACDLASARHSIAEGRHYAPRAAVNHSPELARQISFLKG